jgi:hypothetical protein
MAVHQARQKQYEGQVGLLLLEYFGKLSRRPRHINASMQSLRTVTAESKVDTYLLYLNNNNNNVGYRQKHNFK